MKKSKKILWGSLITLDVGLTVFLFVVSIILLATMPSTGQREEIARRGAQNMIEWFQLNPTAYLFIGVIPLFVLLIANIVGLVLYVKKSSAKKKVELGDLSDAEKEALKKELLNDLNKDETK